MDLTWLIWVNNLTKRVLDILISFIAIVACIPLITYIAVAIKCESPGPVLFRQIRLGKHGRRFWIYKFRKFYTLGSHDLALTLNNDSRMTSFGNALQKTKLDELPQLWNVLRGNMSMVGPRPETIDFADCFRRGYEQVLQYKPGIFGPNQVFFRNESELFCREMDPETYYREVIFGLKARVDLAYLKKATIFTDLLLMVRGSIIVVFPGLLPASNEKLLRDVEEWIQKPSLVRLLFHAACSKSNESSRQSITTLERQ